MRPYVHGLSHVTLGGDEKKVECDFLPIFYVDTSPSLYVCPPFYPIYLSISLPTYTHRPTPVVNQPSTPSIVSTYFMAIRDNRITSRHQSVSKSDYLLPARVHSLSLSLVLQTFWCIKSTSSFYCISQRNIKGFLSGGLVEIKLFSSLNLQD